MPPAFLDTSIEFLKGVGPQRSALLNKELGIFTFEDLLQHYPFRYVDRTKIYTVTEATPDLPYIQLKGQIRSLVLKGEKRKKHLTGRFEDSTGIIELKWFRGVKWISDSLRLNTDYILFGKPTEFNGYLNIIHPELELASESSQLTASTMQPVYSSTEKLKTKGIDSRGILRMQKNLVSMLPLSLPETLSNELIHDLRLIKRSEALADIHFPSSIQKQKSAEFRLKFEELFFSTVATPFFKTIKNRKI